METDVACQLFKDVPQTKVKYSSYVGDDDSTTPAELVQQCPYELQKFSDIIHTVEPLLSSPPLSGHISKSRNFCNTNTINYPSIKWAPLLSGRGHPKSGPK